MGRPHDPSVAQIWRESRSSRSLISEERNHLSVSLANTLLRKEVEKTLQGVQVHSDILKKLR